MNTNAVDAGYYKKTKLINTITYHVSKYLRLGIQNMNVEVHVADMEFRTIKVDTNPLQMKIGTVNDEKIRDVIDNVEYILWRIMNVEKRWFVLKFTIEQGRMLEDSAKIRFSETQT